MNAKTDHCRILFCGTGGQGVLSAAEVAGVAAVYAGFHAKKSEVHGMAQRGGSVESHVIFGTVVLSPLIVPGAADFLVCFHPDEEKRLRRFLRDGGVNLLPYLADANNLPDRRFVNTYLLGVLSAMLPIRQEHWMAALERVVAKRLDDNRRVFVQGMERGKAA